VKNQENQIYTVAAVMSCYNRRDKTIACLGALLSNRLPENFVLKVYLVDDGSSDGSSAAVTALYPQVNLINGDGSLYWNGGMRKAWAAAAVGDFDYYLWLNDDTLLYNNAVECLIKTASSSENEGSLVIVVGSIIDPVTGLISYGGRRSVSRFRPLDYQKILPSDSPQKCETMNGNCVLISRDVLNKVGNLDAYFTHSMGDMDYGLRATKAGVPIWIAPGFCGVCEQNRGAGSLSDNSLSLIRRWRILIGPKGLPPFEWLIFTARYCGALWILYWIKPYLDFWLNAVIRKIRWALKHKY